MTITSHTIVKNGMPYIGDVLRAVAPYMDRMFVDISVKSDDNTLNEVRKVGQEFPGKIIVDMENVDSPAELTSIRQRQIDKTTTDWILILDDDNLWLPEQLELCLAELDKDPDASAYYVGVRQVIDGEHHDGSWKGKFFSDFLRNDGTHFKGEWPRELPHDKHGETLNWRILRRKGMPFKILPYWHYHLSYVKKSTFRTDEWAKGYKQKIGEKVKLEVPIKL